MIFYTTSQRIREARLTGLSFCSLRCSGLYKSEHGINKPPIKKAKPENNIIMACRQCGKPCQRALNRLGSRGKYGPFCNHICYGKWRTENLSGENSPGWKGGYTLDYGGSHWKSQRNKARKRDNNECRGCGISQQEFGYKLDVHHVMAYDFFDDPKEANKLDNLITLCRVCHAKKHNSV